MGPFEIFTHLSCNLLLTVFSCAAQAYMASVLSNTINKVDKGAGLTCNSFSCPFIELSSQSESSFKIICFRQSIDPLKK